MVVNGEYEGIVQRDAPVTHGVAYGITASPFGIEPTTARSSGRICPNDSAYWPPGDSSISETTRHVTELAEALCAMHKTVVATVDVQCAKARTQRNGKRSVKWFSDHRLEVQQLVPPSETSLHHTCRLRLYCKGARDIDEDLKAQIPFGNESFYIEALQDLCLSDGA
ncbi:hypothetical protein H257_19162 [Aphanomyces astaci]|uniref:Uncharacterized protein n=1 Tax=Aphanomyces astaci TaxID=112090 RepID=W4FAR0_APHAT|nr:hypothetical protein H257_19162 [Aphanomyces astaci]ETV63906.1 hypothetical protein H257_19162 [Aphanomyces astaci]|eukprot:XP_009846611.1 hypothetical protein H257_19162 [Aphanomyces astaci]